MNTFILLTNKPWHDDLYSNLCYDIHANWIRIKTRNEFTYVKIKKLKPAKIFIPHWSHLIPPEIFNNFECIVFHMTDLPYGRGGSPLQNMIIRGFEKTMISALRVTDGLDTGDIYLKEPLSLLGTAEEIFIRSTKLINIMINKIICEELSPLKQEGNPVIFKRRKPDDSDISKLESIESIFNFIRMLDCEGYPSAYIEKGEYRFEFTRASLKADKSIIADVRIIKK